jgi:hypothetical protein
MNYKCENSLKKLMIKMSNIFSLYKSNKVENVSFDHARGLGDRQLVSICLVSTNTCRCSNCHAQSQSWGIPKIRGLPQGIGQAKVSQVAVKK